MIELMDFQKDASSTISERYRTYASDRVTAGTVHNPRLVPFFQALSSITASGKTVILADAIAGISMALPTKPVVLWLSKGKVVVEQALANLLPGGKYHHLLGSAEVRALGEYDSKEVAEVARSLVFFATVGTFNRRDKENGSLVIYRSDIDNTDQSIWDALKERTTADRIRRPLIVVYDEGHNLSNQQTELLLELEPDALLLASATMRLPERLKREVETLRANGWSDDRLVTKVDASAVAESGLVKSSVLLMGYQSPMEETVSSLLADMGEAETDAAAYGLNGLPKAIYVCKTNIVAGNASQQDDPRQPFTSRQAPPILIWRYLVEVGGVDPDDIALYCTLKMDKDYPAPDEFNLFRGGEKDFGTFTAGDYRHIIFNLSLQEGWDDPLCYFAYIDKSMESEVQVEQVIGRLLRQPGARHYGASRLNTAHFYVRVDKSKVFSEVIETVGRSLSTQVPGIEFITTGPGAVRPREYQPKMVARIPGTALDPSAAVGRVSQLIERLTDYRNDTGENVTGAGSRAIVQRQVGEPGSDEVTWEVFEQSSHVMARWIFQREIRSRHQGALGVAPTDDPKFDAEVGLGSNAEAHLLAVADEIVDAYVDAVNIYQKPRDPYEVGSVLAREEALVGYANAVHVGYDGLNTLERRFAEALDARGELWCRNPSRTGYRIPLPNYGPTSNFFPDFVLWTGGQVILFETKGGHLMADAAMRKLLWIERPPHVEETLRVMLISEGRWRSDLAKLSEEGYTLWGMDPSRGRTTTYFEELPELIDSAVHG